MPESFGSAADWNFVPEFEPARRDRLLNSPPYERIVERLRDEGEFYAPTIGDLGNDEAIRDCRRALMAFKVSTETLDLFFNGPAGLRAQYWLSADLGRKATDYARAAISGRVKAVIANSPIDRDFAERSLLGRSSKIWIWENRMPTTGRDLIVARWLAVRDDLRGLSAYRGQYLRISGAWLDDEGGEHIASDKANRDVEIHLTGFT